MKNKSCYLLNVFLILIVIISSCNSVPEKTDDTDMVGSQADTVLKNKLEEVYYTHLSPTEIISYFENEGFDFKPELINPLSNKVKYINNVEKLLNIGSYSADVTYQILCKKNNQASNTFKVIKDLCNEVNIESAFNESIKQRVLNNINKSDSLTELSNEIYISTVNNVRESGAHNKYVIISAGSFVETMFLIVNSVKNDKQADNTLKKIIEQKLLFNDLYSTLLFLNTDENVSSVISDIDELKVVFEKLDVKSENLKIQKSKDGTLILSGENKIIFSNESFNALKNSINKLRTKWTGI